MRLILVLYYKWIKSLNSHKDMNDGHFLQLPKDLALSKQHSQTLIYLSNWSLEFLVEFIHLFNKYLLIT